MTIDLPTVQGVLFWIVATLTGLCAVSVVLTQNIVRSATWLLFALGGTAGIFFLLGADFVGASQLFIYVGGTLVLVVFGVMLTAQGPFISMKTSAAEWFIALGVGLLLYGVLAVSIVTREKDLGRTIPDPTLLRDTKDSMRPAALGGALLNVTEATPAANISGGPAGKATPRLRMGYLLPFEIVSVHLLVVLIGAAYLARAKRRRGAVA